MLNSLIKLFIGNETANKGYVRNVLVIILAMDITILNLALSVTIAINIT